MKQKSLNGFLFSFFMILLHISPLLCLWTLIIVGAVINDYRLILLAFGSSFLLIIPRLFLVSFNLINFDEVVMKSFRYFVRASGKEEKERNARIVIIYRRNICTCARSLRVAIDNAKWPFINFVTGKPEMFAVSQGRHVIYLNDAFLSKFTREVEIDASSEYLVRITFSSRNSFLLHKSGEIYVEYIQCT